MLSPRKSQLLLAALLEDYPDEILTGYIVDAQVERYSLIGTVYKSPYHWDGERITAEIDAVRDYGHRYLVHANHYDCFVIVNFHQHGGRQSMTLTIDQFECAARVGSKFNSH